MRSQQPDCPYWYNHRRSLDWQRFPRMESQRRGNTRATGRAALSWGRLVESSIGAYLLNQSIRGEFSLHYWREGKYEVDFILEKAGQVIAIEVKSSVSKQNMGLEKFKSQYNPQKIYMIDNKNLSWEEFLKISPVELF